MGTAIKDTAIRYKGNVITSGEVRIGKRRSSRCSSRLMLDGSTVANDICYAYYNQRGTPEGHCGSSSSATYMQCLAEDVKCGLLQCSGGSDKPLLGEDTYYKVTTKSLMFVSFTIYCKSTTIETGSGLPDPGLVQDGTKCDEDRVCFSNKCVNLKVVLDKALPCPVGTGGQICSGRGICKSDGNCQCNAGYQLPDCSSALATN
eukprot:m.40160 g.40160  ORF g.40160 m.40160 type:complete len:203 (+) comp32915_c1_seq1:293-901(+)